nr:LysR family transcriptional regulator [Telmatospirillum sp. J64-1]
MIRLLIGEVTALGPGKAALLEAIGRSGSISGAAREMGMSYRRAWLLVDRINAAFRDPMVETAAGGKGGGGATLTPHGREVLARYRALEEKARRAIDEDLRDFAQFLRPDPPTCDAPESEECD